jgi:vancomycin resistance protein YoaR
MPEPRLRLLARCAASAVVLGALAGGGIFARRWVLDRLPVGEECLRGVRVAGEAAEPGETAEQLVTRRATAILATRVRVNDDDEPAIEATLGELGASIDAGSAAIQAGRHGREGGLEQRIEASFSAERGEIDVPLRVRLPFEELERRLAERKLEGDQAPRPAKLDFASGGTRPDEAGRLLDVHALAAALERSANEGLRSGALGEIRAQVPWLPLRPHATAERVAAVDRSVVVSRYETVFGAAGGQAGRGRNIARAAAGMDGVVLFPGETVSFNENVGPRSIENGFAIAAEIFKGEMRQGIGGGTCQVAGTLHAAAFFGGLDVVQRSNHSRPSGYIGLGLDATVVYPEVDLRLRNPFEFPVVVRARIELTGGFGKLIVEILGSAKPAEVKLATAAIGHAAFKRKLEEMPGLAEGQFRLKQRGIRGVTVKKTRTVRVAGSERVEVTVDVYPPTQEIYLVPKGIDPTVLPPLPEAEGAPAAG